jgi:enamine deaminase RidA (YjgF/YER057c/UK114 family)
VTTLLPPGWPRPRGYANAIVARGRLIALAGQIGWNPLTSAFDSDDFVAQTRQALANIVAILTAGGAKSAHLVRLTWYVTDRHEYARRLSEVGAVYRETIGAHYPAMTLVEVAGLLEPRARVEIEALAVVPE